MESFELYKYEIYTTYYSYFFVTITLLIANFLYLKNKIKLNPLIWIIISIFTLPEFVIEIKNLSNYFLNLNIHFDINKLLGLTGRGLNIILFIGLYVYTLKNCKLKWVIRAIKQYKISQQTLLINTIFSVVYLYLFWGFNIYLDIMKGNSIIDILLTFIIFVVSLIIYAHFRINDLKLNNILILLMFVPGVNILFYVYLMSKKSKPNAVFVNLIYFIKLLILASIMLLLTLFVVYGLNYQK